MNPNYKQARTHALLIRAGVVTATDPSIHPEAPALAASSTKLLPEMGKLAAEKHPGRAYASGFGLPDFGNALADVLREATFRQMANSMAHELLCKRLPVQNFLPTRFVRAEIDTGLALADEAGEFLEGGLADLGGLEARIRTYGRNILVSRQLLLSDDIGLIANAFANFGVSGARLEAKLVYGLLESNPALGDGELLFDAAHGNVVAAALDEPALGEAFGRLRSMLDPFGEKLNLDAAVLAVSANLEVAARRIAKEAGLVLDIVASPWLANGRWYLLPSPEVAPVIGLLRLWNTKFPVLVEPMRDTLTRDGSLFAVRADMGVVALGRTAVRGGA